jgi:putative transposase
MSRSTFYYWSKALQRPDKYQQEKKAIAEIYHQHKGRYGYRRITSMMRRHGHLINHKTVQRLMQQLGLKSLVRIKRYKSYRGNVGKITPNLLQRQFKADRLNEKWVTDVTEFKVADQKLYLSTILDLYNGEIIAYQIEGRPVYGLVREMLTKAFARLKDTDKPMLHSDQGWHYQMKTYQDALEQRGIRQSMSRKGNCLDNAVMENFFGLLKTELYYLEKFESAEQLKSALEEYIHYYNHERIKLKLKGLSPVEYRTQPLLAA